MEYYAHTSASGYEMLIDHLTLAADLSEKYASVFKHGRVARQIALLHDVGKRSVNFQKVLKHQIFKQDHAIVSAVIYATMGKEFCSNKHIREIIELVMAGHHSYLYSDSRGFARREFKEQNYMLFDDQCPVLTRDESKCFVVSNQKEYDDIKQYIVDNNLFVQLESSDYFDVSNMSENERMFYSRMLFSCLVDADYSATSIFCNQSDYKLFQNKEFNFIDYLDKLDKYHDKLTRNAELSELNDIRNYVYKSCADKGSMCNGFVTLTAPTGTGKTLALMKFALEQAKAFRKDRIFVVLPYLSIINQNAKVYKDIFGVNVVLVDDSETDFTEASKLNADRWDSNIIVTTSVKFFETLFANKAIQLRKLHNVANSVIVFDECQTLPPSVLNSTVEVLQSLTEYYNSTVLFSTATKPEYSYRDHDEISSDGKAVISSMHWQAEEIIDDVQGLFDRYDKIKNTELIWDVEKSYTNKDLIDYFKNVGQVVYIFNTVAHAQSMYNDLLNVYDEKDCYLITGQFCASDKLHIIKEINEKLDSGQTVYLSATQCIEAGVDFDFKFGAREYAPLDSIAQSAGRINRNGHNESKMLIFQYYNHGRYDYPSSAYKHAAEISMFLAEKIDALNFYDAKNMREYYKRLYSADAYKTDSYKLFEAEFQNNYKEVSEEYKFIKNTNQVMIIVQPLFDSDVDEFNNLVSNIVDNNYTITKSLMRALSGYTISIPCSNKFDPNICATQLSWRSYRDPETGQNVNTNWYLLRPDSDAYTKAGFSKESAGNAFFGY